MAQLSLSFLGPFEVRLGDQPVTRFESDKVRALLAYLAVEAGKPHRRSALADLLWPDYPESSARSSLRNALADLRRAIQDQDADPPFLLIERETVQLNPSSDCWLDVHEFETLIAPGKQPSVDEISGSRNENLKSAIALYRGPFLQGFSLRDSPPFDEWSLLVREDLHRKVVLAYFSLVREYELREEYEQACVCAYRLVALEPWHEEAHRQLMRLLALSGQRAEALAQYEACRRSLEQELGVSPDAETIRLYEQIRDGEIVGTARVLPPLHNLPALLSRLIGRESELQELSSRLEDPVCRLLTLLGPGGCGKTRLALEAAHRRVDRFKHGVYFIALAGVHATQAIPQALAGALGFSFRSDGEPWQQILDYLRHKQVLLVLDNFEHLLEGAGLVVEILRAAPGVKILVTSRARLNLMEESLFPLSGMAYPAEAQPGSGIADLPSYAAVQLFLEGARRVKPGFTPGEEELHQIGAVCRQVAGLPLAVLLASSWAGLLKPAEIAAQIHQRSLDFLETEWRDVPERHRSLRFVFDHSWDLLTAEQQGKLAGLSIFPGSFTFQAARAVTEIELGGLRDLVDRSLVQPASAECFELHMLMRQYAAERLGNLPDQGKDYHDLHCIFFMEMLAHWATALQGPGQGEAQRRIAVEAENIRQAWEWALVHAQYDRLAQGLDGLGGLYERLCLYRQGEQVLQASVTQVKADLNSVADQSLVPLLARMLGWQSSFSRMLGNYEAARQAIEAGMDLLESRTFQEEACSEKAFLLPQRGLLEYNTDRGLSQQNWSESLALYRLAGDAWREAQVLTSLGQVATALGHYQKAVEFFEDSLTLQRVLGDTIGMIDTLSEMCTTLAGFGDFEKMAAVVQEKALIIKELGSLAQLADNLIAESVNLCYLGQFAESARRMEEAIAIFEDLGNRSRLMILVHLLGWIETNLGLYDQGYENYQAAFTLSRQLGDTYVAAMGLWGLGEIFKVREEYDRAQQVLEESISCFRQVRQADELSMVLATLADVEYHLGLFQQAKPHLQEAFRIAAEIRSWQASLLVVGKTALCLALQGEVERGVELDALVRRYPYRGKSRFWEDTVGKPIAELAAGLPAEVVTAAQERGRRRDLHATVRELAEEFESPDRS